LRAVEQMLANHGFASLFLFDIDDLVAASVDYVVEIIGGAMKLLCADDEVHVRQPVNEFASATLSHAAQEAEHDIGTAAANISGEVFHLVNRFLFRQVAHAARVQQNHVRDVFRLGQGVALRDELGGDRLAVPFVHLATVGFDVNTRHWQQARRNYASGGGLKSSKIPSSQFQEPPRLNPPIQLNSARAVSGVLAVGIWDFFGAWRLEVGACASLHCCRLARLLVWCLRNNY